MPSLQSQTAPTCRTVAETADSLGVLQVLEELVGGRRGVAAADGRVGHAVSRCERHQREQCAGQLATVLHHVAGRTGRRAQLRETAVQERPNSQSQCPSVVSKHLNLSSW